MHLNVIKILCVGLLNKISYSMPVTIKIQQLLYITHDFPVVPLLQSYSFLALASAVSELSTLAIFIYYPKD